MIVSFVQKIFGTDNMRALKRLQPLVREINALEPAFEQKNDDELKAMTPHLRGRLERGETLDDILPEAFAAVREASRRTLGMRPFDVQLIGGITLHQGTIAEMATGEGKTLVATLPAYLNALSGNGVHIITVNDYLARRDCEWMGKIFTFLGLSVDVIHHGITHEERARAYRADITYGTNTEFGFDFLRDNMALHRDMQVQRGHNFAIIDEVDSILIDEARTPLIISGPVERIGKQYFHDLKNPVERLMNSQNQLISTLLNEAEALLPDNEYDACRVLLKVKRGAPKNKRFLKLVKDGPLKKIIDQIELDHMRDKNLHEVDAELFFSIDERSNTIDLSDKGRLALSPQDPDFFVLPDLSMSDELAGLNDEQRRARQHELEKDFSEKSEKLQNISQLLKAYSLFEKDVNYVVNEGKVQIVDEFTGRILPGRRYSDGLHQAIEAKENVRIEAETQTLASITIQNYFRMYAKLSGMTGTAETEAPELLKIYKLNVLVIPTNKPVRRVDYTDVVYKTKKEKYRAIIDEIVRMHEMGRPVLVGTVSVETSELLSRMIPKRIKHSVLNAKRHQEEASIVANAGQAGAVTIATNMAGRGTDIKLGTGVIRCQSCCHLCEIEKVQGCSSACPDPVKQGKKMSGCRKDMPCGLHIIGTERHESRRIDRQLRGRSARQGDPGSSRFFLSLEDDLLRIFGADRISNIMNRFGMEEGEPIEHKLITRAIENAQRRVENRNFEIRKHLLQYDDVMNKQREIIYALRNRALYDDSLEDLIHETVEEIGVGLCVEYFAEGIPPEEIDVKGFKEAVFRHFATPIWKSSDDLIKAKPDELEHIVLDGVNQVYRAREQQFGTDMMRQLEKWIFLRVQDELWKDHLLDMDHLREGIGLRGYAQQDPLREYQREAYDLFLKFDSRIKTEFIEKLFTVQIMPREDMREKEQPKNIVMSRGAEAEQADKKPVKRQLPKVGRNDPCPCGSGKKHKKCCGQ